MDLHQIFLEDPNGITVELNCYGLGGVSPFDLGDGAKKGKYRQGPRGRAQPGGNARPRPRARAGTQGPRRRSRGAGPDARGDPHGYARDRPLAHRPAGTLRRRRARLCVDPRGDPRNRSRLRLDGLGLFQLCQSPLDGGDVARGGPARGLGRQSRHPRRDLVDLSRGAGDGGQGRLRAERPLAVLQRRPARRLDHRRRPRRECRQRVTARAPHVPGRNRRSRDDPDLGRARPRCHRQHRQRRRKAFYRRPYDGGRCRRPRRPDAGFGGQSQPPLSASRGGPLSLI